MAGRSQVSVYLSEADLKGGITLWFMRRHHFADPRWRAYARKVIRADIKRIRYLRRKT